MEMEMELAMENAMA